MYRSLYTAWKGYLGEVEKVSKTRLGEYEQIASAVDQLKETKSHKSHIAKKYVDHHLK